MTAIRQDDDQQVSRWFWYSVHGLLIVTVLVGTIGIVLSMSGTFDPHCTGGIRWQRPQSAVWEINAGTQQKQLLTEKLPIPPFTLEVNATLTAGSDPAAQWQLLIQNNPVSPDQVEAVGIDGSGNYWHGKPDARAVFPHLRLPGQPNQVMIDVNSAGNETIRYNHEVAWQGTYALQHSPGYLTLIGVGGWQTAAHVQWLPMMLCAP